VSGPEGYFENTKKKITEKAAWKHFSDGNELAAAGKIVEAVAEWQLAVSSAPGNKTISDAVQLSKQKILNEHNARGTEYIKAGKMVEAIAEFNAALGIDPADETAKKGIELTNSKFKNLRDEEKTKLEFESYMNRALSAVEKKDYVTALGYYDKADRLRSSPETKAGIATLKDKITKTVQQTKAKGDECVAKADWVGAVREWRLCLSVDPKNKDALAGLEKYSPEIKAERDRLYLEGLESYGKEEIDTAIAKWKDVLVLDPDHQKAQLNILKATRKQ
jgi:tetratricopeptide (TPR) repeat protein